MVKKWKELNIPYDIHAPHSLHNLNLSLSEYENYNFVKYEEVKKYADELEASAIVFHGGSNGDVSETAKQIKSFNDDRIIIENKPYKHKNAIESEYFVGSKIDEIQYIINESNCGFCLDIGHAIASANFQNIEPYSYIAKFIDFNPKRIHLSDININSKFDEHLNFGVGTLNFIKVISMLRDDIPITIETIKSSKYNLDDFAKDALYLKKFWSIYE